MTARVDNENTVVIDRPLIEVFEYICDISQIPNWSPAVESAELVQPASEGLPNFNGIGRGAVFNLGYRFGLLPMTAQVHVSEFDYGRAAAFRCNWPVMTSAYRLVPTARGTVLSAENNPWAFGLSWGMGSMLQPLANDYMKMALSNLARNLMLGQRDRPAPKLFFCYRRQASQFVSGRILDPLKQTFGPGYVFHDYASITPGEEFRTSIQTAIQSVGVFLVLITEEWERSLKRRHATGAHDDVVEELKLAKEFEPRLAIIPVLAGKAEIPDLHRVLGSTADALPDLASKQAFPVRPDPYFHEDHARLVDAIWTAMQGGGRRVAIPQRG